MAKRYCILDSLTPIHYSISPNTLRRTLIKVIKIISGNKKLIELRTYPARRQRQKVRKSMTYTSQYEINFEKKIIPYQSFMRSKRQILYIFLRRRFSVHLSKRTEMFSRKIPFENLKPSKGDSEDLI